MSRSAFLVSKLVKPNCVVRSPTFTASKVNNVLNVRSNVLTRNFASSTYPAEPLQKVKARITHAGEEVVDTGDFLISESSPGAAGQSDKEPIDLIAAVPPIEVAGRKTFCDGGVNPALGHPRVFINLDKPGPVSCGYCGLRFIQVHGHHHH